MSDDNNPDPGWWFNTKSGQVEHGHLARSIDRLGPYPDRATAEQALQIARQRTEAADKADKDWND
ncbi:MAG: hypothetical protein M3548_09445 [Actinomycetota bacterium]|nr:hypothetical protein [Actinomycetota bacterium]